MFDIFYINSSRSSESYMRGRHRHVGITERRKSGAKGKTVREGGTSKG